MKTDNMEILMNRELDGENSAADSVRLREHLEQNREARAHFAELQNAFRILDDTEVLAPPEELRGRILTALDREADQREHEVAEAEPPRAAPYRRLHFRPGYAFAAVAGFLLGMLVWQQTGTGGAERPSVPDAWLRGSQLQQAGESAETPLVSLISGGGAQGRFRIWYGATSDLVSLELEAEENIRLELAADLAVRFQDLEARPAGAWNLSAGPHAAALEGRGSCTCTFVVERSGGMVRGLVWRLLAAGEVVDRGELSIQERGETP